MFVISVMYAQISLPSSFKAWSEFNDNEAFLRYNFEEHKADYIGQKLEVLYTAYKSGITIRNLSTLETSPWVEEDGNPYIEGVVVDYMTLGDFLDGMVAVPVYAYIVNDGERIRYDEFWHSFPDTNIFEYFLEQTKDWIISDIDVLKFKHED